MSTLRANAEIAAAAQAAPADQFVAIDPASDGYPPIRKAWMAIGLLMIAYTFCFLDRQLMNVVVEPLKADLHLTDTEVSYLQGISFALFYSVLGIPLGLLADRRHRRNIILAAVALWSAATLLCGLSRSFWELFFARMLVGIVEAALHPAAYSMIFDLFRPNIRGRAITLYASGIYVGSGAAYIAGGQVLTIADRAGAYLAVLGIHTAAWQTAFIIAGLGGILFAPFLLLLREPTRKGRDVNTAAVSTAESFRMVLGQWRFYAPFMLATSCISIVSFNFFSWTVAMLGRKFAWPVTDSSFAFGMILLLFGPIGMLLSGWLVDRTRPGGRREVTGIWVAGTACALVLPCALLASLSPDIAPALIGLVGTIFLIALPSTMGPFVVQVTMPNQYRGLAVAIYMLMVNIIGLGVGPTVSAMIGDGLHLTIDHAIAITCVVVLPIGVALYLWSLRAARHIRSYA